MEEDYHKEGSQEVTTLKERVNLGELQSEARKTLREIRVHLISWSPHCHTAALLLSSLIATQLVDHQLEHSLQTEMISEIGDVHSSSYSGLLRADLASLL
jgi:hypothetical protein